MHDLNSLEAPMLFCVPTRSHRYLEPRVQLVGPTRIPPSIEILPSVIAYESLLTTGCNICALTAQVYHLNDFAVGNDIV